MAKKIANKKPKKELKWQPKWQAFVVAEWRDRVVKSELDPDYELDWFSLWCGFVIGLGYPDLATYRHYMDLGFPVEMEGREVTDEGNREA
jgi:hypothetical protein